MSIEPKLTGWQSVKSKLIAVIRIANQVKNARITRSGAQDSISFSGNSMVINLKQFPKAKAGGAGGGGVTTHAFQLVAIDSTTVGVRKGTVNNVIPTIAGTPLSDDVTSNTFTIGAATTFYLNATSTGDIDTDGINAVAIQTTDPGSDTASQTKQQLGSVGWSGSAIENINSNLTGSQNVDSCGASHSWNVI